MRRSSFFFQRGGGGSKPNGEKTALIFLCSFWAFLVQIFRGRGGGPTIYGGGGGPNAYFYRI